VITGPEEGSMSDFMAGDGSGAEEGTADRANRTTPALVLLAALGIALLISVSVIAFIVGSAGSGNGDLPAVDPAPADVADTEDDRVLLSVSLHGDGSGRIRVAPPGEACRGSCEYEYKPGTRVVATASPADGSAFEGWDSCSDRRRCSFVLEDDRSIAAAFGTATRANTKASARRPAPTGDCEDGTDNDGDGLKDFAQDPGCDDDGTEAGGTPAPAPTGTTPATRTPKNECSDRRDNDGDGLTDRAQDPDCVSGDSEGGASAPGRDECNDGRDNDRDGLTDTEQDPGCVNGTTESSA